MDMFFFVSDEINLLLKHIYATQYFDIGSGV